VRREVLALVDEGYEVDVVCTRRPGEPARERNGRLRVYRIPIWHRRGGLVGYLAEYSLFFLAATIVAGILSLVRRYRLVQVHTLPDSLVFAAAIPRLRGARVLLDLHECMPEFFATRFGLQPQHPMVRAIGLIEQAAIRYADRVITCTEHMRAAFVARGALPGAVDVILNASDEGVFDSKLHPERAPDGNFVLVCHGALETRYGLDTVIRAVSLLSAELPGLALDVFGEGTERANLQRLAADLGVADRVRFSDGFVPMDELVSAIARADAGVVAVKRDAFRDLTHCNKMYDFIAMQRPVLVSRTESTSAYFDESCFAWFEGGDAEDLARTIRRLHDEPEWRQHLVANAARSSEPYRWPHQRRAYLASVRRTVAA
jgi:glycosyltransferase involved in cell wall biosynthesis